MSRPLLPNTQVDATQRPTSQTSSQDPKSPGPGKSVYAKRGKITIVACVPCRRRKTKCDGKRPRCGQCTARDGDCTYDMTDDQRKLTYLRDHSEKLEAQHTAMESLISALQTSDEEDAQHILRRIRDGENVLTVADQVQAGKVLFEASQQDASQDTSSDQNRTIVSTPERMRARIGQYQRLLQLMTVYSTSFIHGIISRLKRGEDVHDILKEVDSGANEFEALEPDASTKLPGIKSFLGNSSPFSPAPQPPGDRPAHAEKNEVDRWTEITSDDELLRHLLGLYFTWQHAFFQNFPEHLFHGDYANRRTKYCSKALVSAICASGCFLSAREALRADCQGDQVYVSGFYDEAMKHLNEASEPDLPNTAAMYLISFVEGYRGHRSGQWMVGGRSALMALDLRLHLPPQQNEPTNEAEAQELQDEALARSHAFWGCFHVMQCNSLMLERLPIFHHQSVTAALPEINPRTDEEIWKSYEMAIDQRPGARDTVFRKCAELSLIANSMQHMFYAPTERLTGSRLVSTYEKYTEWHRNLPTMVRILDEGRDPPPPPHLICLHLYYHSAVLLLFRPFLTFRIVNSSVVPREVCQRAADAISNLWTLHRKLFGTSGIWQFQLSCLLASSTIHILYLSDTSAVEHLTHACNTFQELQTWQGWAREALEVLRARTKEWKLTLPRKVAQALFKDSDAFARAQGPSSHGRSDRMLPPKGSLDSNDSQQRQQRGDPRRGPMADENYADAAYHADQTYHFQPATADPYQQGFGTARNPGRSPKRAAGSVHSASSSSSASQQKRQRITSPSSSQAGDHRSMIQQSPLSGFVFQPSMRPYPTSMTPISQGSQSLQQSPIYAQQQPGTLSQYMYNPSGQAPMLQPAGQNPSQLQILTGRMRMPQQQAQQYGMPDAYNIQSHDHQQPRPESRSNESAPASANSSADDPYGLYGGVDGLTFAEDWRVPYMGWLNQQPQGRDHSQNQRRQ